MATFGQDILTTAVEGGIGYWGVVTDAKRSDELDWLEVTLEDATGEDAFEGAVVVRATQLEAAARTLQKAGLRADLQQQLDLGLKLRDAGMIDADVADAIVQTAAFGEVMFG